MVSFMPQLMEGKVALVLGVANRWSIAHAIIREGAQVILTYQSDRQKQTVEELAAEIKARQVLPCDVTQDAQLDALASMLAGDLKGRGVVLSTVVHSSACATREDLSRRFVETSRAGFTLAQDVSAYSLVAVARAT